MGVEYQHWLAVNDANWLPAADTVLRVEAVLYRWNVAGPLRQVVDLGSRRKPVLVPPGRRRSDPGPGIAVEYMGVERQSIGGTPPEQSYVQKVTVLIGTDYRIQPSSEGIFFEVVSPAVGAGGPLKPYTFEHSRLFWFVAESFPGEAGIRPPKVRAEVTPYFRRLIAWRQFSGYWRGAVVIDFGKSLPAFIDDPHRLPDRAFVHALSDAFRADLVEIGEIY